MVETLGAAATVTPKQNGLRVTLDLPRTSRVHGANSFSVRAAMLFVNYTTMAVKVDNRAPRHCASLDRLHTCVLSKHMQHLAYPVLLDLRMGPDQ